jgi:hypothetical protein
MSGKFRCQPLAAESTFITYFMPLLRCFSLLSWYAVQSEKERKKAGLEEEDEIDCEYRLQYFVISARLKGEVARQAASGANAALTDWVPIAQLLVLGERNQVVTEQFLAVSMATLCREAHCALTNNMVSLKSIAAPLLEYAAEPLNDFEKHVYPMFDASFAAKGQARMTRKEALTILFEDPDSKADGTAIKRQYRKLSMKYHPDRAASDAASEEDVASNQAMFGKVQAAYETIGGETHSAGLSWYESIGGNGRTEFKGPLDLSLGKIGVPAKGAELGHESPMGYSQAVQALSGDITQFFASRNMITSN